MFFMYESYYHLLRKKIQLIVSEKMRLRNKQYVCFSSKIFFYYCILLFNYEIHKINIKLTNYILIIKKLVRHSCKTRILISRTTKSQI